MTEGVEYTCRHWLLDKVECGPRVIRGSLTPRCVTGWGDIDAVSGRT